MRKNWNDGGILKWRGKLTATAFCRQFADRHGSNMPLIPLLTKGGQLVWQTEEKFDWKKLLWGKNWNGEGEMEMRGKLTVPAFCMQLTIRGWWQQGLIPLVN